MDERDCENCKYDNASCFLDVTADALSLLKAQGPRVMSLEEMQEITEHDFIWIEGRKDEMIYCLEVVQVCKSNERTDEIALNAPTSIIFIDMDQCKDRWRCWTSRPTEEQQKAVKWE
jgi:predicted molibdopterin-dependent oxidoreductase YjgC